MDTEVLWLAAAFLVIALIYASVGQAGASGYIAAMALAGFGPAAMRTTALALNLRVASIDTAIFLRSGRLSWRNVWPISVLGFNFSLLGGTIQLPEAVFYPAVGAVLVLSGVQMGRSALRATVAAAGPAAPPLGAALVVGAVIGFVSGLTGTGGGVFLAPIILGMNWGTPRQTAATTAVYNLMNSGAALIGAFRWWGELPPALPAWLAAVAAGGAVGAFVGGRHLSDRWLRGILALLLLVSGLRLML